MSKFLKALRVAGDVAEIIVASSIVVEFIERFRAKKKAQVQTVEPADEPILAEVTTTENKWAYVNEKNILTDQISAQLFSQIYNAAIV